ncbi:MAG: peptide-methionine (R)-S-oxide reductase, partial [Synechococcaceae cyanobacterium]|nr:peptide-methionine (R)-S-oxide reductase [Synechococcaceae cyanobacterium]
MPQPLPRRALLDRLLGLGAPLAAVLPFLRARAADAAAASTDPAWRLSDAEWRKRLSPAAYAVLRREGTERPFSSPLNAEKRSGTYVCAGCRLPLFSSRTKFDSGTGWPSFWQPLPDAVATKADYKLILPRTEYH